MTEKSDLDKFKDYLNAIDHHYLTIPKGDHFELITAPETGRFHSSYFNFDGSVRVE